MYTKITSYNILFLSIILGFLLLPVSSSFAQSDGLTIGNVARVSADFTQEMDCVYEYGARR